ncbi:MrpH family fimbial adhesin [Serratia marcescens]|uniref:MrpH family fimbial adhesin n=1 Tax=Serratia marcescens TaxID=615 RepID=UPI001574CF43|nr:hypothetical protein [Serratia marcescens]NSM13985.1 hypothetical protein [Serratia marcescens]NSM94872.1 hypothetical protein [Serratia marcescens]CAF2610745.1 hypothetical protein AI2872V1_4012 [Serratia marcescens]CAF2696680.1 hypothetical protein AI2884V1_4012 [Serratia marcescens]CAH5421420.1 hypothetical protein AI2872V1_4012 [Serratia marcescens]
MQRFILFFIFLAVIGTHDSSVFAAISLNEKWEQNDRGKWSLSITPRGTFDLTNDMKTVKCISEVGCEGMWKIDVRGRGSIFCDPKVLAPRGMTGSAYVRRVESAAGGTCTLSNLTLDGSESICILHEALGGWRDEWNFFPGLRIYNTRNCYGGGGGVEITPPIKPLNCSLSDISLTHGTIDYRRIPESEAIYSATAYCNRQATVKISVANGGRVNLNSDGTFYSLVSIMDKPGDAQLSVNGNTPVKFSSRLYAKGNNLVIRGAFRGTAVVVMNVL